MTPYDEPDTPPSSARPRPAPNVRAAPGGPASLNAYGPLEQELADRYRWDRVLGRGGMATVFLVHDLKLGRRVALKVLQPELGAALGRERFQQEIQFTAQLQHPHILPVLESGEAAGRLWYTMPFAEGDSLRALLDRKRQLGVDTAVRIVREVAEALACAHEHGVVHRDIKPENILFAGGHAVVADFGIARAVETIGSERLTETGLSLGTPHYMSPEQSMGEKGLDGRSDLYALASVLYEMLAGEPPYTGASAQAIIAKRLTLPVPSVRTLRETVPEHIEHALAMALAKSPADRFETTGEFVAALDSSALDTRPTRAVAPSRSRIGVMGVAAVGIVAAAVAGWQAWRSRAFVPASASVMAVFPLGPTTADTGLSRLGRDLATTISASLDGVGDIRTVDRLTMLSQVSEHRPVPSLRDAAALGRRLGATSVVHGTLAREGSRVRLDVGLYSSDSLTLLARGAVLAAPESLSALSDSVAWRLLAEIWRRGTPPTPTIEAVTTHSLEALRAFLDGERFLVTGHEEDARAAYGRAIAADSSFWFAYFRYGNSMGWIESEPDSAAEDAYWSHRHLLPVRERMMIEAARGDSGMAHQRRQLEEIVRRYPDYGPGWWMLGDKLLHFYGAIGATRAEAQAAFERVVSLTPSMVYAWEHLAWAASEGQDTAAVARAVDMLLGMNASPIFVRNENMDKPLLHRTWLSARRRDGLVGTLLDTLCEAVVRGGQESFVASIALQGSGLPQVQVELNRRLLQQGLSPRAARSTANLTSFAWGMRGAWDSALAMRDGLVRGPTDTLAMLAAYRTAVLAAWVGALPAADAAGRRAAVAPLLAERGPGFVAELAWLDGIEAVTVRDSARLAAARRAVRQSGAEWTPLLDRSLAAFEASLRGDTRTAASEMTALELQRPPRRRSAGQQAIPHVLFRGVNRLAAAEWLLERGEGARAVPLLQEGGLGGFEGLPLSSLAILLRARIANAQGDTASARRDYQNFLLRYDLPMPPHRHLVIEAREALERLAGTSIPATD